MWLHSFPNIKYYYILATSKGFSFKSERLACLVRLLISGVRWIKKQYTPLFFVNIVTFVRHDERVDSAIFSHEKYVKRLENLFVGFNIANDSQKRALLLHYSGEEVNKIFDTLPDTGSS